MDTTDGNIVYVDRQRIDEMDAGDDEDRIIEEDAGDALANGRLPLDDDGQSGMLVEHEVTITSMDELAAQDDGVWPDDGDNGAPPGNGNVSAEASSEAARDGGDLDRCRVCLSKSDLLDLFALHDGDDERLCEMLIVISRVKIAESDRLPNFLCLPCADTLRTAWHFKAASEQMDKELRSKLRRSHKAAVHQKRSDFILVDTISSTSSSEDEATATDGATPADAEPEAEAVGPPKRSRTRRKDEDDDFRISDDEAQIESEADSSDSDLSDAPPRKMAAKRRQPQRRNATGTPRAMAIKKRPLDSDDFDEDDNVALARQQPTPQRKSLPAVTSTPLPRKRGRPPKNRSVQPPDDDDYEPSYAERSSSRSTAGRAAYQCPYCEEQFDGEAELREHKKKYIGQKPLQCKTCGRAFKKLVTMKAHVCLNNATPNTTCQHCGEVFSGVLKLRRHVQVVHGETYECPKCKRAFLTQGRLSKHIAEKCPHDAAVKRKSDTGPDGSSLSGRDLFKDCAPLTTTYWSDSFSD